MVAGLLWILFWVCWNLMSCRPLYNIFSLSSRRMGKPPPWRTAWLLSRAVSGMWNRKKAAAAAGFFGGVSRLDIRLAIRCRCRDRQSTQCQRGRAGHVANDGGAPPLHHRRAPSTTTPPPAKHAHRNLPHLLACGACGALKHTSRFSFRFRRVSYCIAMRIARN